MRTWGECGIEMDDKASQYYLLYFCILLITLMATISNLETTSCVKISARKLPVTIKFRNVLQYNIRINTDLQ